MCTYYGLREDGVRESTWKMTEFYRDLLDEWNKEDMFKIGWTDESKKIVTHTGRTIYLDEPTSKESGCITRLRCDGDWVYVDMVKLYLWTLEIIMDEAEEKKREEQWLLIKKAMESENISCTMSTQSKSTFNFLS